MKPKYLQIRSSEQLREELKTVLKPDEDMTTFITQTLWAEIEKRKKDKKKDSAD